MQACFAIDLQFMPDKLAVMVRNLFTLVLVWSMVSVLQAGPLKIASLNTVMADLAKSVGGGRVEVAEIVHAGVDPHLYEPAPGDWKRIETADILLAGGLGFEPYLERMRPALASAGVRVVAGGDVVTPIEGGCEGHGEEGHHHHGAVDPHWWHSVSNTRAVVFQIRDALIAEDPEGRVEYEAHAEALDRRLQALDQWVRLQVAMLPKGRRVLVTSHDALGYLATEYGFEVLPVQGVAKSIQPSSQQVMRLIREIKRLQVKALFAESLENPKVLEQITAETGARRAGALFADGLGTGSASTYEGMMKHNVVTIVEALK